MKLKKFVVIMLSICITEAAHAKPPYSGDIVGRNLNYPGTGWLGHVGIVTGDNVGSKSDIIIETLNESPVIQINHLNNFKSRSPYWGSKYGIGDYKYGTLAVLVEANHQRWWCPKYTTSTAYVIGTGDIKTGKPTKCGLWRCDTFVAWSFFSAGYYQLMNNKIMLPLVVYNTFPYANTELRPSLQIPKQAIIGKEFSKLSTDELNKMSYEEFVMVADIPLHQETPTHIAAEWKFAKDGRVNEIKRGIFIDRLSMSNEKDVIPKFLEFYQNEPSEEIRSKLIQGTVIYYQGHRDQINASSDYELLKAFYNNLLYKELSNKDADNVIRGFVDFHSPQEILKNQPQIDKQLIKVEPNLALGLQLQLASTSKELEEIYIHSIIKMLEKYIRSDLDDMFFGLIKFSYKNLSQKSQAEVKTYINSCAKKYLSANASTQNDPYFGAAKSGFIALHDSL